MQDVRNFLIDQGLIAPHESPNSAGEFRIECPDCHHTSKKCYVNGNGQGLHCFHCKLRLSWRGFQRRFLPPSPEEVAMERFVSTCHNLLLNDAGLIQWFANRGITLDTIKSQRFGVCYGNAMYPAEEIDFIHKDNYAGRVNLAWPNGQWYLDGHLTIPYIHDGVIQTVRGRVHPDAPPGGQKYLSLPASHAVPYFPTSAVEYEYPVVVCEGEFDATALRQNGIQAIGIPGSNAANPEWFSKYPNLFICLDGDEAGRQGTDRLLTGLSEVRRITMPEGYDISDYLASFGIDSFKKLLESALLYLHGKPQKDDRFSTIVHDFANWAWTNGTLLGPKLGIDSPTVKHWAPRLEEIMSGWAPGLVLIGAEANCLAVGSRVLMFDGTTKAVEDVVVGDKLMGPDSKERNVLKTFRGTRDLHRVYSTDGSVDYTVTGNHILMLREYSHGFNDYQATVEDFYGFSNWKKSKAMTYRVGVEYPSKPVRIDPYFLGLWLGDGTSRCQSITSPNPEIVAYLYDLAARLGGKVRVEKQARGKAKTYEITGASIRQELRSYNLLNNKHIPQEYLSNDREVRASVLAGIIDTDGYYDKSGTAYEVVQKNETLARDIAFLAQSLGLHANVKPTLKTCTNAPGGPKTQTYYRINLSGDFSTVPIKVPYKKYVSPGKPRNMLNRTIQVEPVGIGEYAGFQVDGDSLFLSSDFIVLHNCGKSCMMIKGLYEMCVANPDEAIGVYLSLDDTLNEAMLRLVSLHAKIDFNMVKAPRWCFDHPDDPSRRNPEMLEAYNEAIESLSTMTNLILRDATWGRSLTYLRTLFKNLRGKHPDKKIVVFIDSLAKITAETVADEDANMGDSMKSNFKAYLASELKYLSTKYNLCIVTPTDLRKLNGIRRPTRDDLKDAAELAYEANIIMLAYNDQRRAGSDAILTWVDEDTGKTEPIFEIKIDKNKVTGDLATIRYRMLGVTSDFWEVTRDEDDHFDQLVRAQQEAMRRSRSGN